jgi:hypothetical protein
VAGVVFAFHPYHLFQSSHPVLVSTQFIPFFVLALLRVLYDTSKKQVFWATVWFLLTALSSWHLMMMLVGWTVLYLIYSRLFERDKWTPSTLRYLIVLITLIILTLSPFLYPIVREQLTSDTTYMTVDIQEGRSNDLLSFLTPNRLHPVFAPFVLETNSKIGYTRNWPAYLGYVALGLGIIGIAVARRRTRFWGLTGLLFFVLSLGPQIRWRGTPLHTFYLPWAIPIVGLLRHPFRLNSLLFLSLAVLVGFGSRWLYDRIAARSKPLAYLSLTVLASVLLFEYLTLPFPTTRPSYSPFIHQLAQEEGDFAVADFPLGRQAAKYYLFFQTIHEKKIVDGHVSRTPDDAYAFVDADPLLGPLRNENVPTEYIKERMAILAAQDIRYIIVHKRFFDAERMALWQRWLVEFPPPFYEDEMVIVYRTAPPPQTELLQEASINRMDVRLGDHIRLRGYRLSADTLSAGEPLTVTLFFQSDSRLVEDNHVFVHLLDEDGQLAAQHDGVPVHGERPTWSWWDGEVIQDEHTVPIDASLPNGTYVLSVGMYDYATGVRLPTFAPTGEGLSGGRVELESIKIVIP